MENVFLLVKIKLIMMINGMKAAKVKNWLKVSILSVIGAFFMWGLYALFYRVLVYLQGVPLLGPILMVRIISMIFLLFFAMLIFSNIITSFSSIYFSSDLDLLLVSPLSFRAIFLFKFFETMFYSSWMVLFFLVPVMGAYGRVSDTIFTFYLWVLVFLLPFFVICASLGILASLVLMRIFPTKKTRDIFLVLGITVGAAIYIAVRFIQPEKLVNPDVMLGAMDYLASVRTPMVTFSPSYWITEAIVSVVKYNTGSVLFYLGLLTGTALILLALTVLAAGKIYYAGWAGAQEGPRKKKILTVKKRSKISSARVFTPLQALFIKDIKIFFRDTSQWSQLLLLLSLVVVYLYNIYKLPLDTFYLKSIISFLNIGLTGFVVASVALRFVFPAVSLEKESFWIIRTSPLTVRKFLWEKFWVSLVPLLVLAGSLIVCSNLLLKVDSFFMILSSGTVCIMTIGLTGLGIGMGSIFPRFNVENVAQIESSVGGLFYMVFALFYVAAILVLEAWPVRLYFFHRLNHNVFIPLKYMFILGLIFLAINIVIIWIPIAIGSKTLKNLEI
jgi:ABC-2 type transport system permease protein